MERTIYLDNSATTRPYDQVIEYIGHINRNVYGNPSSLHRMGLEAEKLIRKAREVIADTLKVDRKEIYFTSGGTESNNLAIRGYLDANPRKGKHIITSKIEHPSVMEVCKHLSEIGYDVDYIDVNSDGIIDLEGLKNRIRKDTALISIMYVNNEIGSVQPVDEIVKIRNQANPRTVIHMDAVQAYGKFRIYPKRDGIQMLSISSHKIHGPKGAGALYVDSSIRIRPIIYGGGQESLIRSGTENITGICGFGLAAELIFGKMDENLKKVKALNSLFRRKLAESSCKFKIISPESASPYILSVAFPGVRAEVMLHHLEERGIFVSTGSACSSRKSIHSHVLKALGLEAGYIEGAVRFSFSGMNQEDEICEAADAAAEIACKLQSVTGGRR